MQVLVIEDDPTVQVLIKAVLRTQGQTVSIAKNVEEAKQLVSRNDYDMIILDLGLPDGDGYTLCKDIREEGITTPILILSGEHHVDMKVKCLQVGADDYLTKPFDTLELTARMEAIMRRMEASDDVKKLKCGEIEVDLINRTVHVNKNPINLTNNEFSLLVYLMQRNNEIISPEEIAEKVWDIDFDRNTNYINVYFSYLRKKIREYSNRIYIETVRKKGFVFRCNDDIEY